MTAHPTTTQAPAATTGKPPTMTELPLCQIALSVGNLQHSHRWYRDLFGYQESGGTYLFVPALGSADVQGVPEATSVCWWLMDSQDFFQIELFQFSKPIPKPLPTDWRPCDIGYSTIGIHVADFDATLDRLRRRNVPTLTEPLGERGARRVCLRDPDGVLLELMEDDPRAPQQRERPHQVPVATRFVTVSVPDLDQARHTWVEVLGLTEETEIVLHTPEHEALWGLGGATRETLLLRAGDIFVEVVHYLDPVGKGWPEGYRISDHGILNVALGVGDGATQDALIADCTAAGITPNSTKPTVMKKLWYASYVNDPMGFSVELLFHGTPGLKRRLNPFNLVELGFAPRPAPVKRARATALSAADPRTVWQVLLDHEEMPAWSPFQQAEVVRAPVSGAEVGTVRRLRGGPLGLAVTETIVAAEPGHRLEYTAEGAPATKAYHGFVTLEETPAGGTRITWEAQFRSPLPGATRITTATLKSLVAGLAATADAAAVPALTPVGAP